MARTKVDNKLNVVIGTKAQVEADTSIPENSIVVVTDEELKADEIVYSAEKNVKEAIEDLEVAVGNLEDSGVDIVDNLTTDDATKVLSAKQGKVLQDNKVDKQLTIIGLDLQDNILIGEFRTALGNATQSVAGLLSAADKTHLDSLVALLETSDSNNVVDTIGEILAIFQNYPEGADLVTALQGKVDKVVGKGLSTNDFTDEYKNKVDTLNTRVNDIEDSVDNNTQQITYNQNNITQLQTSKQDKLVAGENITIDENNVIEVDLNSMAYFNYASRIYGDKYSLLVSAWEHSLIVDPSEISATSTSQNQRGTAQYPNGEIEGVIIPQGVTSIGSYAFYDWSANNKPLVIPSSVTSISNYAFTGWSSNNHPLVIPNSVTSIGEAAFQTWSSNNHPLIIPNSVISISDSAFSGWSSNNHPLVIPNSVTSIGGNAFYGWTSNNQPLVIPNSVTSIGYNAFQNWTSNNHPLVIPSSVTSIGTAAFYGWLLVPYVEIQAITPPTLAGVNAFGNQKNAPIYVPDESVDDYKEATNWVDLADRIFSINDKE